MTRRWTLQITTALLLIAMTYSVFATRTVQAQQADAQVVDIPKSYGFLKGAVETYLIFEDSSGTIRLVATSGTDRHGNKTPGAVRYILVRR